MISFSYARPETTAEAIGIAAMQAEAEYLGGGTNLVDLMRETVEAPKASLSDRTLGCN
jgi:xanthine dehydrogenase YagS FAD-binding subunit